MKLAHLWLRQIEYITKQLGR